VIGPATYKLAYLSGDLLPNTAHANQVKMFVGRQAVAMRQPQAAVVQSDDSGDPDTPDNGRLYTNDKLVDHKVVAGTTKYLVHWVGHSARHRTWEPAKNIFDKKLMAEFDRNWVPKTKRLSKHFRG
jgi:hypothetical protein